LISEVVMPNLGATGGDVTLDDWLVKPGDAVKTGQPLFVVTTDKATVEVEAFRDGVLREVRVQAGETVPLGTVVALLANAMNEPLPAMSEAQPALEAVSALSQSPDLPPASVQTERLLITPLARRIAEQEGLNPEKIAGSGRGGQILKRDVVQAVAARRVESPVAAANGARREALSPMRRAIAERTQRSKSDAPHFYATITIDMKAALDMRQQAVDWATQHGWMPPSITDLCLRAAALVLRDFPMLNARFDGDALLYHEDINLGLVVGLDDGMLIPVIRQADRLNLTALAAESRRLRQRAEAGQLSATELTGGTFTLSNLGMFGLDSFTAVINPPEAGILALGAVKEQPAVINGAVEPRPLMIATLSVDHRVVDGITAARFVAAFKDLLEHPLRLTLDAPQEVRS
jgi:pyruvate dehydrogenase E2 component (dihydrolipoamide acetyltransferase)